MAARALPEHNSETLMKYGRRLFDAAARAFRKNPTQDAQAALGNAADALVHAARCHAGATRDYFVYAAHQLNGAAKHLNDLLATRGAEPFAFVE